MEMVTESVPVEITSAGTVITKAEYTTLLGMLQSRDPENHTMAQQLLNRCDIKSSIYWIWKLSKSGHATRMVYLRTKASRNFQTGCSLFEISSKDSERFAKWCLERHWLTTEIFQYLRESILNDLKGQCKNRFFSLKTMIKPEYLIYDPESKIDQL